MDQSSSSEILEAAASSGECLDAAERPRKRRRRLIAAPAAAADDGNGHNRESLVAVFADPAVLASDGIAQLWNAADLGDVPRLGEVVGIVAVKLRWRLKLCDELSDEEKLLVSNRTRSATRSYLVYEVHGICDLQKVAARMDVRAATLQAIQRLCNSVEEFLFFRTWSRLVLTDKLVVCPELAIMCLNGKVAALSVVALGLRNRPSLFALRSRPPALEVKRFAQGGGRARGADDVARDVTMPMDIAMVSFKGRDAVEWFRFLHYTSFLRDGRQQVEAGQAISTVTIQSFFVKSIQSKI